MRAKLVFEKFVEDSDPITDMGIGMRHQISQWMKEIGKEDTDDNALIQSAKYGKLDFVKYLVQNGANIHADDDYALRWASEKGHLEVVKYLVQNGADIHANNDRALQWASNNGHLEVVKFLVQKGTDIHANDDQALQWASENGHIDIVKFLVQNGANIHTDNDWALRRASSNGHLEVVKFLVQNGANIHANNDRALQWASYNGHLEVVKYLVQKGANIHVNNDWALQWASENGHLEVVKYLVQNGADINAVNSNALQLASKNGHLEVIKYLKSKMKKDKIVKESLLEKFVEDSDPIKDMGIGMRHQISKWMKEKDEKDTDNNALIEAAYRGKLDFVKYLVQNGANIHANNDAALRWTSLNGHTDVIKYLVQNGADIHAESDYALRYASANGHLEVVKYLVQNGADIRADNDAALRRASKNGHLKVIKYLVQKGADIHADRDNALRYASKNGHLEVVKYLVQNGANIHADDDYALQWASLYGHSEVVKYLESQMKKDKIVKESLLEKFIEDSDPISDMGIGMRHQISRWMKEIREKDTDDNALVYAAKYGKLDFVKFLVQNGANIHTDNDWALRRASSNGHLEVVKFLVQNGANIHADNDWALHRASSNGHLEVIKYLVQNGADIHAYNDYALQWASSNGHLEVVKFLVQNGANIHADNDYALRWASENGHLEVVKYLESQMKKDKVVKESLLEKFTEDSDPISDMGIGMRHKISQWMEEMGEEDTDDNALVYAAKYRKLDFVKYLVQKGADIHADNDRALRRASSNGHLEVVKYLVQNGADIHADRDEALRYASEKGHLEVIKYLVQNGANIHADDDRALGYASEKGHIDIVKFLVQNGANIHADNDYALRWASEKGHLEVVKYLVQNGADIHAKDDWALRWASYNGHLEVIKYLKSQMKKDKIVKESLLEKFSEESDPIEDMGIGMRYQISQWMKEIGQKDIDDNALIQAAKYGKLDFVKYLVQNGANIHARDDYALRWASDAGHLEMVKYLVQKGADIHADNDWALQFASSNGHLEVVKYLVQNGADIHADNDYALQWASNNGHLEVVKHLVQKGADIHANNDLALRWASNYGHLEVVKYLESQIQKSIKEGVGDKYATRKWHIPDLDDEFEKEYQAKLLRENPKQNIIYRFPSKSLLIKNPPNLDNIAYNVRAVIDKKGNLYIQSLHFESHADIIDALVKIGEIKRDEYWWKKYPTEFLTITRIRKTNTFVLGESNEKIYKDINKEIPLNEIDPIYTKFMNIAQKRHPQYKFIAEPFDNFMRENLNESPDKVHINNKIFTVDSKSKAFEVIYDLDNERIIDVLISDRFSSYHGHDNITYGPNGGTAEDYPNFKETLKPFGVNWKKIYPGRLFFTPKVITFWVYPTAEELNSILDIIKRKLNIDFSDWKIEVYEEGISKQGNLRYANNYNRENKSTYVYINDYIGSKNSPEEDYKQHMLSPLLKKKVIVRPGVGSRHPKYMEHRKWERAVPLGDNKKEKYKSGLYD